MTRLIEARGLSGRYSGAEVLRGVDFHIDAGEIVTVVGPNGSGKSTLMRLLVGALTPAAGLITRSPGLRLGYVPQKLAIDPTLPLTVDRFLDLPRRAGRREKAAMLERVGIGGLASAQLTALSGGQYQRALLARALLTRPQLLMLDEATQGMDQRGSADFYALIEDLRTETGAAVLMVSHELHVVMSASDRVICLNGHVCCQGTPEIVRSAPEYRALFGTGTHGALALYRHEHDHSHDHDHDHDHDRGGAGDGHVSGPRSGHGGGSDQDHRDGRVHGAGGGAGDGYAGGPRSDYGGDHDQDHRGGQPHDHHGGRVHGRDVERGHGARPGGDSDSGSRSGEGDPHGSSCADGTGPEHDLALDLDSDLAPGRETRAGRRPASTGHPKTPKTPPNPPPKTPKKEPRE